MARFEDENIDLTGVDFSGVELEEFDVDNFEDDDDMSIPMSYRECFEDVDVLF